MSASVTDQNFQSEVLNSTEPVVVDFWAEWCGPCKMMSPIVDEISNELAGKVKVVKINIDEKMAKVSIIGAGMLGQPGVAAQMFDILGLEGINVEIISTSEISISCLVAEERVKDAVRVIHDKLLLDDRG